MNKLISTLLTTLFAIVVTNAQQISVVSENGATTLHRTLQEAIEEADPGSVIYLPGGGFSINSSAKITKKLTIIGIGHKANIDNVNGITTVSGDLFFSQGSDGSAVMGCYITGGVKIGSNGASVNDILIKSCNIKDVTIYNKTCKGTVINQNYIRSASSFNEASAEITNNVCSRIEYLYEGIISNNVIVYYHGSSSSSEYTLKCVKNSFIANNVFTNSSSNGNLISCDNSSFSGNMIFSSKIGCGNEICSENDLYLINLSGTEPNDVFANYNNGTISPASDFHFKDAYKQYDNSVGVYADGVLFDKQLPPVPYIVTKRVDEQTDASGMLNIKIRVKAGE